jgi:5-methylcytosine-specific restriction endonuclease McrA
LLVGCLALNASFEPLTMVPLRRALRLVIDGKAEIVEADHERVVRSERLSLPRPAVIRLNRFVHVPRRFRRQVTNTFMFARDRYRCQYCGRGQTDLKHRESLTRDHVVPISRGGTNDWTNVVTACSVCNTRKANRLPGEIGMHPLHNPVEPHFVHLTWAIRRLTPTQAHYIRLFYGEETLHYLEDLEHRRHHNRLSQHHHKHPERVVVAG